jgi:calcineurin-like phosphoesterase family protein
MKITNEQLRDLYLRDLNAPPIGGDRPKVRNIQGWRKITTFLAEGIVEPRVLDPFGPTKIYVWSDLHFGHNNIIKYCDRPFPTKQLMNECLIGNYQSVVKDDDIVIFGGDIGFMGDGEINKILEQLPGYKILIYGNHDMDRQVKLRNLAFDEGHLCLVMDVDDHDLEYQLLLTHYPLELSNIPDGCYSVHGHIHNNIIPGDKHINMCVEHTGYKPILLKEHVLNRTRKTEANRLGLPT